VLWEIAGIKGRLQQILVVMRLLKPFGAGMPRKTELMEQASPQTLEDLNRLIVATPPLKGFAPRAVLGEGPIKPDLALVGEQPGDQEEVQGRPFVGPAGRLLDRALAEAGIERRSVYVTNALKHFKFDQRGKRRLHAKPNAGEVKHYRWWLEKELDLVKPKVTVAMGSTAILALAGKPITIARNRGLAEWDGRLCFITVHPSSVLRIPDSSGRHHAFAGFVADLKAAKELALKQPKASNKPKRR
jgi:uracil-DNA glycosylase